MPRPWNYGSCLPTWSLAWARSHGAARMGTRTRRWAAQVGRTRGSHAMGSADKATHRVARTAGRLSKTTCLATGPGHEKKPTNGYPSFEQMGHAYEQGFDVRPREGRESPREPREGQGPMEGRWVATARPDATYPTHPFHTPTSHPPDTTPTRTHTHRPHPFTPHLFPSTHPHTHPKPHRHPHDDYFGVVAPLEPWNLLGTY